MKLDCDDGDDSGDDEDDDVNLLMNSNLLKYFQY